MTYRRLFLILLVGSTVMLAGAWWVSFKRSVSVSMESRIPPVSFTGSFQHSTVYLSVRIGSPATSFFHFHSSPATPDHPASLRLGDFGWHKGQMPLDIRLPLLGSVDVYMVRFPIWLPYLLFIASAWGLCRVTEERVGGLVEKELAEGQAAGKLGRETDSSMAVVQSMEGRSPNRREHEK